MAGMLFPDIAGALSSGAQAGAASAQGRFLMEDRAARNEIAPLIPKALQGDREALDQIGARHPDTLMKLAPLLERADAATRARAKEASEWTTKAAMGVLSLPEAERPAAYQAALADGQRLGYKIDMPPQYDRAVEGRLRMVVNQARSVSEFLKSQGEGVTFAPPAGGGGAPAPGGGVNQYNIGNVRPVGGGPQSGFQQPASLDDGIRLAINNVKAYPAKFNGGQPMTLLQIGERWAPRGDGANDPVQWARNVASIGGLDPNQPLNLNDPMIAAKFARGVHGAEHGANKVLPPERYAQAITGGAQPPGLAQGSDMPAADGSGTPLPPAQQALAPLRGLQIPPGARVALQGGVPIVKDGNVLYVDANGNWGAAPLPSRAAPKEQGTGPFAGTGMDAQAMNILLRGDPASPEYSLAYAHLSKPRTTLDDQGRPVTIQPMDLSAVRKPAGSAAAPAGAPGAAPGGTTTPLPGGGSLTVGEPVAPKGPSAKEVSDLRTARVEAETIIKALEDFRNEFKNADYLARGKSVMGMTTGLNTSYNVAALLAKGEALFNLGVLNGPDLDIIRRTLPDPATMKGAGTNTKEMDTAVDKVVNLLNTRLSAREKQLGIAPTTAAPAQPQTAKPGTYMGPDNKPVNWPEIEATAKNRGITPDEVINRLGLKPTGMQ